MPRERLTNTGPLPALISRLLLLLAARVPASSSSSLAENLDCESWSSSGYGYSSAGITPICFRNEAISQ
jgi:hypothetical protein